MASSFRVQAQVAAHATVYCDCCLAISACIHLSKGWYLWLRRRC